MKAIVTGGAGFIGSHLVDRLIDMGVKVIVLDNLFTGKVENIHPWAKFFQIDVSVWDELLLHEEEFEDTSVIFHLAASKKHSCLRDPVFDLRVNAGGTLMLLQLAVKHGIKKFIHTSTGSVYGSHDGIITEETPTDPVSYYGVSKLAGERYVQVFHHLHGLDTTILRIFHVWGNRQSDDDLTGGVIAIFRREIKNNGTIHIHGDGGQERCFTHVSSIVDCNIAAWENPKTVGHVYNCASERRTGITEMAHMLMNHYGNTEIPLIYGPPLLGDIYNFSLNTSKIKDLGIHFIPFNEGINTLD